jgi:hypothetical protein
MAVIGSTYSGREGNVGYWASNDNNTSNANTITPGMVTASDGTNIYVDLDMWQGYKERFSLLASAEGNPKTSYKSFVFTNTYTTTTAYEWTFSDTNSIRTMPIVIDSEDNVYVPLIGGGASGSVAGAIYFLKYSKPSEGWRAWANGSSTTLTYSFSGGADTTAMQGTGAHTARYLKGAWYTNSGHIVVSTWYQGGTVQQVFRLYCLNTSGTMISHVGWGSTSATGASHISSAQFGRGSQVGSMWYNQGTAASADQQKLAIWQVTSTGVISVDTGSKLFGISLDSFNAGMNKVGRITSAYLKDNKLVSVARGSGGNQYYLRVDLVSQTSKTTSLLQSDTTYSSQPGGSFSASTAANTGVYLQPFAEENFVRIWTVDNSGNFGYLDAFINPTTNAITYDTQSYSVGTLNGNYGSLHTIFQVPTFGKYYDFFTWPSSSTTQYNSNLVTLPTGASWATVTTGPSAASFKSPSVSTLNMQAGIKFNMVPTGSVGGRGFTWFGRTMVSSVVAGYRLKRTISGTDTYYDATTQTWSGTAVTNANTTTAFTIDIPASAGFASSGTYTFALALVDIYGDVTPYGTVDTIVSTDSSAPNEPTAIRFIRKTLIADTDAHEYTFDTNALVNKITVANAGNSSTTFAVRVGGIYLIAPVAISAGATLNVDTSQRVDADDRVLFTSTNGSTDVYISGTIGI